MEHVKTKHEEISMLNSLFAQQSFLGESFHTFRQDIGNILQTLIDGQNSMKTELLFIREKAKQDEVPENARKANIDDDISVENCNEETYAKKTGKNTNHAAKAPAGPSKQTQFRRRRSNFLQKPKVLYIGDSVAANANFAFLEKESNSRIRSVKAYTL